MVRRDSLLLPVGLVVASGATGRSMLIVCNVLTVSVVAGNPSGVRLARLTGTPPSRPRSVPVVGTFVSLVAGVGWRLRRRCAGTGDLAAS